MKRRDFLANAAAFSGLALPALARGDGKPCPPGSLGVQGGTVVSNACAPLGAESDWLARSTGNGVVWAHRFNDSGADYWLRPSLGEKGQTSTAVARRITSDGILGDGCLEIFVPAGQTPGLAGWGRPLAPVTGGVGYSADVNKSALRSVNFNKFYSMAGNVSYERLGNMRGGCFGKDIYFDPTEYVAGVPEFVHSGTFWLQWRMKLSASKGVATEFPSKLLILDHMGNGTAMQEVVLGINAKTNPAWPAGPYFYTAQGSRTMSRLMDPQGGGPNAVIQTGGEYSNCRLDNFSAVPADAVNKCWSFPLDQWITVMIGVTPGTQNVTPDQGYNFPSPVRDAGLVIKVASAGAKRWTTICNKSDFYWYYSQQFGGIYNYAMAPNGFNAFRFTLYNGGGTQSPVSADQYARYDQVICSTAEIPLPSA